jgi:hypothetical protein
LSDRNDLNLGEVQTMTATATILTQRYDSPTARLDITGRELALSQWSDRPVVQVHRFHLWLHPMDETGDESRTGVEIQGDRAQFLRLQAALQAYVADTLQTFPPGFNPTSTTDTETASEVPTFTPQGLTGHQVQLGSLRTQTGASTVTLGSVQLADLTQVFAQLDQQVHVLPVPLTSGATGAMRWQRWSSVAAGFVAVVGLAALWPYLNPGSAPLTSGDQAVESEAVDPADTVESAAEPEPEAAAAPEADSPTSADSAPPADADIPTSGTDAPPPPAASPKATTAPSSPRELPPSPSPAPESTPPEEVTERDGIIATGPSADAAPEASAATGLSAPAPLAQQRSGTPASAEALSPMDALAAELAAQWEPPDDLQSVLRYRLTLNADGTVTDVVAIDSATEDFPLPAVVPDVGQMVLPPGVASALRLTLYPDGSVTVVPLAED